MDPPICQQKRRLECHVIFILRITVLRGQRLQHFSSKPSLKNTREPVTPRTAWANGPEPCGSASGLLVVARGFLWLVWLVLRGPSPWQRLRSMYPDPMCIFSPSQHQPGGADTSRHSKTQLVAPDAFFRGLGTPDGVSRQLDTHIQNDSVPCELVTLLRTFSSKTVFSDEALINDPLHAQCPDCPLSFVLCSLFRDLCSPFSKL